MLEGIKIIDLTRLLPGPFGTLILAGLGAEVIKVEDTGGGDYLRWMGPQVGDYNVMFDYLNRGKKSLSINLKHPKGREIFIELAKKSHAVVEQFRPGVMDKLGLGYDDLKKVNRAIVYCSLSGYGADGPLSQVAGHDLNYIALAGLLELNRRGEDIPVLPPTQIADLTGGVFLALSVLAGLLKAKITGEGTHLDISMHETVVAFMSHYLVMTSLTGENLPPQGHELTGKVVCYNVYRTKDGRFFTLAALEPKFWQEFIKATGRNDLAQHQFSPAVDGEEGYEKVKALFMEKTFEEWKEIFSKFDACAAPSLRLKEVLESQHLQERETYVQAELERGKHLKVPVIPPCTPEKFRQLSPAPHHGEHTAEILKELGYNEKKINMLTGEGVVKNAKPESSRGG